MKLAQFILIASLSLVCCSNSKNVNEEKPAEDNFFSIFIKKFDSLQLPITIIRKDLYKYGSPDFGSVNQKDIPNQFYQFVDAKYYRFLQKEINKADQHKYQYLFASKHGDFFVILYIQIDLGTESSFWIKMNTLTDRGDIQDMLVLAGMKANVNEKYVEINKDWKINTTFYQYLPDEKSVYALVANKEVEGFAITSDGHFKKIFSSKQKGYYKIGSDNSALVPYKKE